MNVLTLQSTYGGLLHDTGKAVYRAGGQRGSHSEQGCQFLHGVLSIWPTCFPARLTAGRPKAKTMPTGGSFRWMRCSPT